MAANPGFAVFTYGTLMNDQVVRCVTGGRVPPSQVGKIRGYRRRKIRGQCYPAVSEGDKQDVVHGRILLAVTSAELAAFDAFEDSAYQRLDNVLAESETGETLRVRLYARAPCDTADLYGQEWSLFEFEKNNLPSYLERCQTWADEFHAH